MQGPTAFIAEVENCILCPLHFDLPIQGQLFWLCLCFYVLTQFSGERCVYVALLILLTAMQSVP